MTGLEEGMVDNYLQCIYYDSRHPGAFSGPGKLLKAAREDGRDDLILTKIKNWLASQDIYTGHR